MVGFKVAAVALILLIVGAGLSEGSVGSINKGEPAPTYMAPGGDFSVLERINGKFRRTMKDKTIYNFNNQNKLESVSDRNGNLTSYVYDTAGRLNKIIDPVGLETLFTYTGNKITAITDPANRITLLEYDNAGNLTKITDPDNTART